MMNSTPILLAASLWNRIREWAASKSGTVQMWAFVGVLILISLVIFFWVISIRDRRSRHRPHHHHRHHRDQSEPQSEQDSEENTKRGWFFSKQRRRRRKKKRRANPTLAETGGLPEPRDPRTPPHI